jgi:hypothetical protein
MARGKVTKRMPTRSSARQKTAKAIGAVSIAHLAAALCTPAEERPSEQSPAPNNPAGRPLHQGVSSKPRQNPWLLGSSQMATGRFTPQTVASRNSGQWLIQPEMIGTKRECSRAEHQPLATGTGKTVGADRDDTSPPWQPECTRYSISPTAHRRQIGRALRLRRHQRRLASKILSCRAQRLFRCRCKTYSHARIVSRPYVTAGWIATNILSSSPP